MLALVGVCLFSPFVFVRRNNNNERGEEERELLQLRNIFYHGLIKLFADESIARRACVFFEMEDKFSYTRIMVIIQSKELSVGEYWSRRELFKKIF